MIKARITFWIMCPLTVARGQVAPRDRRPNHSRAGQYLTTTGPCDASYNFRVTQTEIISF